MIKLKPKDRERIGRIKAVGYTGPEGGLDKYLNAFPDKKIIFNSIVAEVNSRAKAKKFDTGGLATEDQIQKIGVEELGRAFKTGSGGGLEFYKDYTPEQVRAMVSASDEGKAFKASQPPTDTPLTKPTKPVAETVTPTTVKQDASQDVKFTPIEQKDVATLTTPEKVDPIKVETPETKAAATFTAATTVDDTAKALKDLKPEVGVVSDKAQVEAQTIDPRDTAVKDVKAAQLDTTRKVEDAPTRTLKEDELVTGPTVDTARVDTELAKIQAAQMDLSPEATIKGQLGSLYQNFDTKNPPAWADGAVRTAMATLNARGLGASSLAGQAVVQAVMESALPIAQADAQAAFNLGIQNLNNKQQTVILAAQQRAQFLGQEFDQAFQTRVTNAARVSEIANLNFSAEQQIALENAKLAQTTDLANLTNQQAVVMANAAQIANLEVANLDNRQKAAVQNAQNFLQMDLTNLSNRQQTALFKSQNFIQALFADANSANAAAQFNASSENQVNQFYDSLANQVATFNSTQASSLDMFNVQQATAIDQFNAQVINATQQFNASNGLVVSQANAEWRRNIATIDTAAQNQANQLNAQMAMSLTTREHEGQWQDYRDRLTFAQQSSENILDRETQLGIATIQKQGQIEAAKFQMTTELYKAMGTLGAEMLSGTDVFKSLFSGGTLKELFSKSETDEIRDEIRDENIEKYDIDTEDYDEYIESQNVDEEGRIIDPFSKEEREEVDKQYKQRMEEDRKALDMAEGGLVSTENIPAEEYIQAYYGDIK